MEGLSHFLVFTAHIDGFDIFRKKKRKEKEKE